MFYVVHLLPHHSSNYPANLKYFNHFLKTFSDEHSALKTENSCLRIKKSGIFFISRQIDKFSFDTNSISLCYLPKKVTIVKNIYIIVLSVKFVCIFTMTVFIKILLLLMQAHIRVKNMGPPFYGWSCFTDWEYSARWWHFGVSIV